MNKKKHASYKDYTETMLKGDMQPMKVGEWKAALSHSARRAKGHNK